MKYAFDLSNGEKAQHCCRMRTRLEKVYEETLRVLMAEEATYDVIQYNNRLFAAILSKIDEEIIGLQASPFLDVTGE